MLLLVSCICLVFRLMVDVWLCIYCMLWCLISVLYGMVIDVMLWLFDSMRFDSGYEMNVVFGLISVMLIWLLENMCMYLVVVVLL